MMERLAAVGIILVVIVSKCDVLSSQQVGGDPTDDGTNTFGLSTSSAAPRRTLYEKSDLWRIDEPKFNFNKDTSQFEIGWTVSDFIQDKYASVSIYDGYGCKDESNDVTDAISKFYSDSALLPSFGIRPDSSTPYSPTSTQGEGDRIFRLFLDVQPAYATNDEIEYFTVDEELKARFDFCIRFSLSADSKTGTNNIENTEVNYQETLVTFFADLTDGFSVEDVAIKPKDKLERNENIECEIIAYECIRYSNEPVPNPGYLRDQGKEVRVCVELSQESKDAGLMLDRITWFKWTMASNQYQGIVDQHSIIFDSQEAFNGLCEYECLRGVDVCPFNTLLRAEFYWSEDVDYVNGIGEGICRLGALSRITEDVWKAIGSDILGWMHHDYPNGPGPLVKNITFFNISEGSTVRYTPPGGSLVESAVDSPDFEFSFVGGEEAIRAAIDTIELLAPMHSDDDFDIAYRIYTDSDVDHVFRHPVKVYAVADPPKIEALHSLLQIEENSAPILMGIRAEKSVDVDNSEDLSVVITVPRDEVGPVGIIIPQSNPDVIGFRTAGPGSYVITSSGDDPTTRETNLNSFIFDQLYFEPRPYWSGILRSDENTTAGIQIEAVSTERYDVAQSNDEEWGTLGDIDTKTERDVTYVEVTVIPVNDLPYLQNSTAWVAENNLNSQVDIDLVVPIGKLMGMTVDDKDGSQSLTATLTGFPTNAINLYFDQTKVINPSVTATIDKATGTVSVSGDNSNHVLEAIGWLIVVLADDDDANFNIEINGYSEDTNGYITVGDTYSLTFQVIVGAVADTPTLIVGAEVKSLAVEGSGSQSYPVNVALNDIDGSERYKDDTIILNITTPLSPALGAIEAQPTKVVFTKLAGVTVDSSIPNVYKLVGDTSNLEAALDSLTLAPGIDNGENITVQVSVTAKETNTAESGPGEIAVETQTVVETFAIPMKPIINGEPVLTIPNSVVNGTEDTKFSLGIIRITLDGIEDRDLSEVYHIDIDRGASGNVDQFDKIKFWVGSTLVSGSYRTILDDGWLRLPNITRKTETLYMRGAAHFSGPLTFNVRGTIVDYSNWNNVEKSTVTQRIDVNVLPMVDGLVLPPSSSIGVEDGGPVSFGKTLSAVKCRDRATASLIKQGNNPEPEIIYNVTLKFPLDTDSTTYSVSYTNVQTASVTVDEPKRLYTITSSLLNGMDLGSTTSTTRVKAQDDIMAVLATFQVEMGPAHSDENGKIDVTITNVDVNLGVHSHAVSSFTHDIIINAVADRATIFTRGSDAIDEDTGNIPLFINASQSLDKDNSEVLSITIEVPSENGSPVGSIIGNPPAGASLTAVEISETGATYLIEATGANWKAREDLLNSFISTGDLLFRPRRNWAGQQDLIVNLTSTEIHETEIAADNFGGEDGTSKTETVTSYITVIVNPTADMPELIVKGAATGYEDQNITIPIGVTITDLDGSESYTLEILSSTVPAGATLYGDNRIIEQGTGGVYVLQQADVENLQITPPLHYSTIHSGNITLSTTTYVTDTTFFGSSTLSFDLSIPVTVIGVADAPNADQIVVLGNEDEDYPLGQSISSLLQNNDVLIDKDGSETLTFVLGGLPGGSEIKTSNPAGLNYIGSGEWEVDIAALATLTVTPPVKHFSGENPFTTLKLRAVTQEKDGDQASSPDWPIKWEIMPIADGFRSWGLSVSLTEEDNEVNGLGVSLGNVGNYSLVDDDGSEEVIEFRFDLSSLLADAGIQVRLNDLIGQQATLSDLVAGYLEGTFTFDEPTGTIVVAPTYAGGIKLASSLFKDSNEGFSIPVKALIKDSATINGQTVVSEKIETGNYVVNICGTADVPTVYAENISGNNKIPIDLGGDTTDTDVALGRSQSEAIYYIIKSIDLSELPGFRFVDANDTLIGFAGGNTGISLTWILPYNDVVAAKSNGGLFFTVPHYQNQGNREMQAANTTASPIAPPTSAPSQGPTFTPAVFKITTVATESDSCKDAAFNSTTFTVNYWVGAGAGEGDPIIPPLPPIVDVGPNIGLEDNDLILGIDAKKNESDTTNPTISIVFSSVPAGFSVEGMIYINYETGNTVALASAVRAGNVVLVPPDDFAGFTSLNIEALAVNSYFLTSSSGEIAVKPFYDWVADGPTISIPGVLNGTVENEDVQLPVSVSTKDADGSESIGDFVYVQTCKRATLKPEGYAAVSGNDNDANVDGISVTGFYRIPIAEAGLLSMTPETYWHGPCDVNVVAYTFEKDDDQDTDYLKAASKTFKPLIISVPTPPTVTAPKSISGDEDSYIPIPGLTAALVDTIDDNGFESLSVVMANVPEGSLFNFGANTGEGKWSLELNDLPKLKIKPPSQYAGSFTMTFQGIAYDHATSTDATTPSDIAVTVNPVADLFDIVARNLENVLSGDTVKLDLNLLLYDTTGNRAGEVPPETVTIDFFDVPSTVVLTAPTGGQISLVNNITGIWKFVGSQDEANGVIALVGQETPIGDYSISLVVITTDQTSVLAEPVNDSFMIYVVGSGSPVTSRQLVDKTNFKSRRRLNESDAIGFLIEPEVCGTEATLGWESLGGALRFDPSTISIDNQDFTSVMYTLPDYILDSETVNWVAIVLPEDPRGQTVCHVPTADRNMTFKGNCFNYQSNFFLLLNVKLEKVANYEDHPVPSFCDVPNDADGTTVMLDVSVPCAQCLDSPSTPSVGKRRLDAEEDPEESVDPSRRTLQDLEAASPIEFQITVIGRPQNSSASSASFILLTVLSTAFVLLSFLQ